MLNLLTKYLVSKLNIWFKVNYFYDYMFSLRTKKLETNSVDLFSGSSFLSILLATSSLFLLLYLSKPSPFASLHLSPEHNSECWIYNT